MRYLERHARLEMGLMLMIDLHKGKSTRIGTKHQTTYILNVMVIHWFIMMLTNHRRRRMVTGPAHPVGVQKQKC